MREELDRTQVRATGAALDELAREASALRHELRNPAASVRLAVGHLAASLGESQRVVLEDLCGRLDRVARRLEEFATLASVGGEEPATVDLRPTLVAVASAAEAAGGGAVEVALDVAPGAVCRATVEPGALRRFLAALVAARAAQGFTRLTLGWRPLEGDAAAALELRAIRADARGEPHGAVAERSAVSEHWQDIAAEEPDGSPLPPPLLVAGELLARRCGARWEHGAGRVEACDVLVLPRAAAR